MKCLNVRQQRFEKILEQFSSASKQDIVSIFLHLAKGKERGLVPETNFFAKGQCPRLR